MKIVQGGQGRTDDDVRADGVAIVACAVIGCALWFILWEVFA